MVHHLTPLSKRNRDTSHADTQAANSTGAGATKKDMVIAGTAVVVYALCDTLVGVKERNNKCSHMNKDRARADEITA